MPRGQVWLPDRCSVATSSLPWQPRPELTSWPPVNRTMNRPPALCLTTTCVERADGPARGVGALPAQLTERTCYPAHHKTQMEV
jgi:hypothetical protein